MSSKNTSKRGLGRGLNALLAEKPSSEILKQTTRVLISRIRPNRYQPRQQFREDELATLTESVRKDGVLMPILLRPIGEQRYEIIAGERRWRASQAAGIPDIPAIIREASDQQALEFAIIENEQRDDLTAIESAHAYQQLMQEFSYTQQRVAESIGISRAQVSNIIRLLQLPESVQTMIAERTLDMGHARPLVGLDAADARMLAQQCKQEQWSARKMEQEAKRIANKSTQRNAAAPDANITALQDELSRHLGLSVVLAHKNNGSGELKIRYGRTEELDGVLQRLRKQG